MQTNYSVDQVIGIGGQRARLDGYDSVNMLFPRLAQAYTITVGGTVTNGLYQFSIQAPSGRWLAFPVTRTGGTPATSALVAAEMRTNMLASAELLSFATVSALSTATWTVTLKDPDYLAECLTQGPTPGTLAIAGQFSTSAMRRVPYGRLVARISGTDTCRMLTIGDALASVAGISELTIGGNENTNNAADGPVGNSLSQNTLNGYAPGEMVSVGRTGRYLVRAETDVTPATALYTRIFSLTTGHIGGFGSAAMGGTVFDVSTICRAMTSATAGNLFEVELRIV